MLADRRVEDCGAVETLDESGAKQLAGGRERAGWGVAGQAKQVLRCSRRVGSLANLLVQARGRTRAATTAGRIGAR